MLGLKSLLFYRVYDLVLRRGIRTLIILLNLRRTSVARQPVRLTRLVVPFLNVRLTLVLTILTFTFGTSIGPSVVIVGRRLVPTVALLCFVLLATSLAGWDRLCREWGLCLVYTWLSNTRTRGALDRGTLAENRTSIVDLLLMVVRGLVVRAWQYLNRYTCRLVIALLPTLSNR